MELDEADEVAALVSDEAKPDFLSTFDQECVRLRILLLLKGLIGIEVREVPVRRW